MAWNRATEIRYSNAGTIKAATTPKARATHRSAKNPSSSVAWRFFVGGGPGEIDPVVFDTSGLCFLSARFRLTNLIRSAENPPKTPEAKIQRTIVIGGIP